jgi:heme exporter protein C
LFLIFAGYALIRGSVVDRVARARACAVIGIVGFANVPIVHFSVLWWRSLHQAPTVIRPGDPSIDHLLLAELLASVLAFTILFLYLLGRRLDLERARDETDQALLVSS